MPSYMRVALDFLKSSAGTDKAIFEAAEVLPLIARRALERAGASGSLDVGLASLSKEAVAEMAVFHMKVAETMAVNRPSREDALISGSNAVVAVICFGYIGIYRDEAVQQRLFEACLDRYARSQALVEALL